MKSNFAACLAHVLESEGGYVNDPHDPGLETNLGISKRSYPEEDIKGMTRERAAFLYRRDFWNPMRCDDLPTGLDLVAFDAAVNSGLYRSAKWLQTALMVTVDGRVGEETLLAAREANKVNAVNRACSYRLTFLQGLPTWGRFGKGWQRRVNRVRETALAMKDPESIWQIILSFIIDLFRR